MSFVVYELVIVLIFFLVDLIFFTIFSNHFETLLTFQVRAPVKMMQYKKIGVITCIFTRLRMGTYYTIPEN